MNIESRKDYFHYKQLCYHYYQGQGILQVGEDNLYFKESKYKEESVGTGRTASIYNKWIRRKQLVLNMNDSA